MAKPVLPKAQRAVKAAHEAGMHDRKPTPDTCRDCAAEVAPAPVVEASSPDPVRRQRRTVRASRMAEPAPTLKAVRKARAKIEANDPPEPVAIVTSPDLAEPLASIMTGEGFVFRTREEWMLAAVENMRPWLAEAGYPVGPVRISFGWPGGRGNKQGVRGQCWMPHTVKDAIPAIFITPSQEAEDTVTLLGIILHEMNHAAGNIGHQGTFGKAAAALGFQRPWTSSEGKDEALVERLKALGDKLGPIDHASIDGKYGLKGGAGGWGAPQVAPPVQSTRMLKVYCPEDGYTLRATAKWLSVGVPACPIDGAEMTVEWRS